MMFPEVYNCNNNQHQSKCHCCCFDDYCNAMERCVGLNMNKQS